MSKGISFGNYREAKEYKKHMLQQGEIVTIHKAGNGYFAITTPKSSFFRVSRKLTGQDRRELSKYNIPLDIDYEVLKPVIRLNKLGYETAGSCAGHKHSRYGNIEGIIAIVKGTTDKKDIDTVRKVLENEYNLQITKVRKINGLIQFIFKAVGIPREPEKSKVTISGSTKISSEVKDNE